MVHSTDFRPCADKFMVNAHLPHQNCAPCALLQRITSPNERAVPRACHIRNDCGNLGSSNRVVLPFVKDGAHLTIRSSRDRFAARLMRYRVAHRRAAKRSGLTQVLDCSEIFSFLNSVSTSGRWRRAGFRSGSDLQASQLCGPVGISARNNQL